MMHSRLRPALAAVLALGLSGAALTATPALAKGSQPEYSQKFIGLAGPLQTAIDKVKGKPDDATLNGLKQQLATAIAAASTADDKYAAGSLAIKLGSTVQDQSLQAQGIHLELDSGKAPAEMLAKLHFYAGEFAYQDKDYAKAEVELKAAIAAGYKGADALTALAEAQFDLNHVPDGLATLQQAIAAQTAAGSAVPEDWYKRGLGVAYQAKLLAPTVQLSSQLVAAYPTKVNWGLAIGTLRDLASYPPRDELDLMRLMGRTNSYSNASDYLEYVQDLEPRRLPGEAKAVIDAGIAAGTLSAGNTAVSDALSVIKERIDADKASMPALDRNAHAPTAPVTLVVAAGDAFLNYEQPAKAVEFYQLALTKPGVDSDLVNTRLGIAQCDTGDYAGAQASFAKVTGARAPLAGLWSVYAKLKAAGK